MSDIEQHLRIKLLARELRNQNKEKSFLTKLTDILTSGWVVISAIVTVFGGASLLLFLNSEKIEIVFIYLFNQPLLLVTILMATIFSIALVTITSTLPFFSLYDDLKQEKKEDLKLSLYVNLTFIGVFPFITLLQLAKGFDYFIILISIPIISTIWLCIDKKVKITTTFSILISSLISTYLINGIISLKIDNEFSALILLIIIYFFITFMSIQVIIKNKTKTSMSFIFLMITFSLSTGVFNALSSIIGIKSFDTIYAIDGKDEKFHSDTTYRFGDILVSCNKNKDDDKETCSIFKDSKFKESFQRDMSK